MCAICGEQRESNTHTQWYFVFFLFVVRLRFHLEVKTYGDNDDADDDEEMEARFKGRLDAEQKSNRENSWEEEAKLIIVFHVIFDKYTHIINSTAVCTHTASVHRSNRCGSMKWTGIAHLSFSPSVSLDFSPVQFSFRMPIFVCIILHAAHTQIVRKHFFFGVSEYKCNIFVSELIFNGSAGSIRVMFFFFGCCCCCCG